MSGRPKGWCSNCRKKVSQEELEAQVKEVGVKTQQDSHIAIVYSLTSASYANINYYSASAGFGIDSPGFGATAWEPLWTS